MHRFYIPHKIAGASIPISDSEQLHHLRDVLRLKADDQITVFDAEGNEYLARIQEVGKNQAILEIKSRKRSALKRLKIAIACAVPKKAKMDDIIDKLTQLDVDTIIPLETGRTVVKLEEHLETRLERWKRIARSAAEQSQRATLPLITPVMDWEDVMDLSRNYDFKLIPTVSDESEPIKSVLLGARPSSILALIGPEGDFTPEEIQQALKVGFKAISLGLTVLRVDTAAVAVASYLKLALE